MTTRRSHGVAVLLVAAGMALTGCAATAGAEAPVEVASNVRHVESGGVPLVVLSQKAVARLGIRTAPVTTAAAGLQVPYSAVVYQADGTSWAFVRTAALTYQRARISISGITGNTVSLTSGPAPGTEVVTVGAAELIGVETGIDGEQ